MSRPGEVAQGMTHASFDVFRGVLGNRLYGGLGFNQTVAEIGQHT